MAAYSKDFLTNLYKLMLEIRIVEENLIEPILTGEVKCPVHLYSGEEAVAAGICVSLKKTDYIFGNHRSHGHFIAKGGSIKSLVSEIFCKETGCSRGRGGSMHIIDPANGMLGSAPIVAGTISLAVGAALAIRIRRERNVAVSFFGDGATNEGVLFESMNFAALKKLPIVFVCENNLYSTHMSIRECRPDTNIYDIAKPFGIDSYQVDGNDVLQVYEVARGAVAKCRNGDGPVFLECLTYRLRGHVGPDDNIQGSHTDIRPKEEVEKWKKKDPIIQFEKYLLENSLLNLEEIELIKKDIENNVKSAFDFARKSPYPKVEALRMHLFA